jgi:hypothetical protein
MVNDRWKTPLEVIGGRLLHRWMEIEERERKAKGLMPGLYVKPSTMWWVRRGVEVRTQLRFQGTACEWQGVNAGVCQRDAHGVVHVLWSMHSDMSGVMAFIQFTRPRLFVPLTIPALTPDDRYNPNEEDENRSSISYASQHERVQLVLHSIQSYISNLLPHQRTTVHSSPAAQHGGLMGIGSAVRSSSTV